MHAPNVLNEVLAQKGGQDDVVPEREPPTAEIGASATEVIRIHQAMGPLLLDSALRRTFVGSARLHQAAVTGVAARLLGRSPRAADRAQMLPEAVHNLLLFETGLGSMRVAVWPLASYGLTLVRRGAPAIDEILGEIEALAKTPAGRQVGLAIGQAQQAKGRAARGQQDRQRVQQQQKAEAEARVKAARERVSGKKGAQRLALDAGQPQVRLAFPGPALSLPRPPEPPAPGPGKKGRAASGRPVHQVLEHPVPAPTVIAGLVLEVDSLAVRLSVAGRAGDPPLSLSLPEPDGLLDRGRLTRIEYIQSAALLFKDAMAPVAALVQRLGEQAQRFQAGWQLYRGGYDILLAVADYQLAAGPAHRLVRRRVLPAVVRVLQEKDLPDVPPRIEKG
jgi:hypothetical protein